MSINKKLLEYRTQNGIKQIYIEHEVFPNLLQQNFVKKPNEI